MASLTKNRPLSAMLAPLVLATWGAVMLDVVATGKIQTLLHPAFHPWVALTGAALVIIAIALVFAPGALHSESLRTWLGRGALLIAPILIALAAAPATYSAYTVLNRGVNTATAPAKAMAPGPSVLASGDAGHPLTTDISHLVWALSPPERQAMDGKTVRVLGQYYPSSAREFQVVRLYLYCCAADASPISLQVVGAPVGQKQEDWIEVTGILRYRQKETEWEPYLVSPSTRKAAAPADPYVY